MDHVHNVAELAGAVEVAVVAAGLRSVLVAVLAVSSSMTDDAGVGSIEMLLADWQKERGGARRRTHNWSLEGPCRESLGRALT